MKLLRYFMLVGLLGLGAGGCAFDSSFEVAEQPTASAGGLGSGDQLGSGLFAGYQDGPVQTADVH